MKIQIYLRDDAGFDVQTDVYLDQGIIDSAGGPDRAYLLMPDAAGSDEETVALWLLDEDASDTLAAVLDVPEPQPRAAQPWCVTWIAGGRLRVRRQRIGVDRGAHLLATLAHVDLLDREELLFGQGG